MNVIAHCPDYFEFPLKEFRGNPLVEALNPPAFTDEEIILQLAEAPAFDIKERELPEILRMTLPNRLLRSFLFPTKQRVSIMKRLYGQVLNGYLHRNPLTAEWQRILHKTDKSSTAVQKPSTISFLTGLSGMGKSTLIRAIMDSLGNPVIRHTNYNGAPLAETQLVSLMRNVPDQASARSLCQSFAERADELVGANLYATLQLRAYGKRQDYVRALRKIVANHHVGAVVIDEFQNISLARSGGTAELLALIINLHDELGVPIILISTYKSSHLLKSSSEVARRLTDGGFFEIERPLSAFDDEWTALCDTAWRYQWVKEPKPFSEEVVNTLYECSQGITGIMLNVFCTAQIEAIESSQESVTPELLSKTFKKLFKPLHPVIDVLKSGDSRNMMRFDDMYLSFVNKTDYSHPHSRLEKLYELQGMQPRLFADTPATTIIPNPRKKTEMTAEEMLNELTKGVPSCE
jgi:ABC-type iron transport system FetAB ATPase subunit